MRLKYLLLLITNLVFFSSAFSQFNFPDETVNQKWEYVTWYWWGGACEARIVKAGERLEFCDTEYIEILDCDENEIKCFVTGYYRVDGDEVWMRSKEYLFNGKEYVDSVDCTKSEGLMFDFSIQENDSLVCQINSTVPASQCDFWQEKGEVVEYEGIERMTRTMRYRPHPNAPFYTKEMKWIDGIGSTVYPLFSVTCIGDHCELEQQLTRVHIDGELVYQDTLLDFSFPCTSWITNVDDFISKSDKLDLYPNPAKTSITVNAVDQLVDEVNLAVLTPDGKVVLHIEDYQLGKRLSIESLASGIYVVQLYNDQYRANSKLVVE